MSKKRGRERGGVRMEDILEQFNQTAAVAAAAATADVATVSASAWQ